MQLAKRIAPLTAVLGLFLASRSADAYCRTGAAPTADCPTVAPGSNGHPIYWVSRCAGFVVQSEKVAFTSDLPMLVDRAFGLWQERMCGVADAGDSALPPSMRLLVFGTRGNLKVGYNPNGANENVIVVGQLPAGGSEGVLALPTVTFSKTTGEILDADLLINESGDWNTFDFPTVMNHETGHLLGLAHSDVADAMMNAAAEAGGQKLKLDADDKAGICAIYTIAGTRNTASGPVASTACTLTVGNGDPSCATAVSGGCTTAREGTRWEGLAAGVLALLCIATLRRRKAR